MKRLWSVLFDRRRLAVALLLPQILLLQQIQQILQHNALQVQVLFLWICLLLVMLLS